MSNTLNIIVTEFKSVGTNESTFGFTASDSYGQHFEDGWKSLGEFLSEYPTPEKLKEHVLSTEDFSGFVDGGEFASGSIYIEFPKNTDTA